MKTIDVDVNKKLPIHFNVTVEQGAVELTLNDVVVIKDKDDKEVVQLNPIGNIPITCKNYKQAVESIAHLRWELGQMLKIFKTREKEFIEEIGEVPELETVTAETEATVAA